MYGRGSLSTCVTYVILEEFGALGLEGLLWSDGMGHDCYDGFGVLFYSQTSFWGWTWPFSLVNLISQGLLYDLFALPLSF